MIGGTDFVGCTNPSFLCVAHSITPSHLLNRSFYHHDPSSPIVPFVVLYFARYQWTVTALNKLTGRNAPTELRSPTSLRAVIAPFVANFPHPPCCSSLKLVKAIRDEAAVLFPQLRLLGGNLRRLCCELDEFRLRKTMVHLVSRFPCDGPLHRH